MQQLYTTKEAARLLGISDGTIRSWLSRFPSVFEADKHIVIQEGKKLWTEAGLDLIKQRAAENAASRNASATETAIDTAASNVTPATDNATQHAANNDAELATFSDAMIDGFTDKISLEIAATIAEKLPGRVLHHIQRMLHTPSTKEREILQHATLQQLHLLPGVEKKYLALPQSK